MSLTAGARLGPYEVLGLIGAGGMGEVYQARDTRLDRTVAIKVLPPAMLADGTARARLLREARLASQLNHPHICTVHDVGEADGHVYIAMELVEGEPLSARRAGACRPISSCASAARSRTRWRMRMRGGWYIAT
jgi:serine/threonine protein kinase